MTSYQLLELACRKTLQFYEKGIVTKQDFFNQMSL